MIKIITIYILPKLILR